MMIKPNEHLKALPETVHGGIDYREIAAAGLRPGDILDFSVNTNPYGPPQGIEVALKEAVIDRYPDSASAELTAALAARHRIADACLCIGSGTTELIRAVALAYFTRGDKVLIPQPAYGEYELSCRLAGADIIRQPIAAETSFHIDSVLIRNLIEKHKPKGVFLCNPNNPTGAYLQRDAVIAIAASAPDTIIVIDEAYIAFTPGAWDSNDLIKRDNIVILRSMTKDYALAGLRIGYMLSNPLITSVIRRVLPPWNVNSVAQQAALYSLKSSRLADCARRIREAKGFLVEELTAMGLAVVPSETNFFLVQVRDARSIRNALLKKRMLVRDCTSFGLPSYIRIAPRSLPECRRLISAMKQVIKESHES